ncbi:hypothetical protein H4R18_002805 [Coemansia javaensis]|uniref:Uncharacterized protein n=1 Tax=Coemansia javaensis TaxID=2761396 RepID=A0A9W8LIN0_9FUNG|nr:hypothetical protein H4R18_002805 [Coemansia javaensis]
MSVERRTGRGKRRQEAKTSTAVVLEEDRFRAAVDALVERDFFPGLQRLQAESQGGPVERADVPEAAEGATLDGFLRTHVGEDYASFSRLLRDENQRREAARARALAGGQQQRQQQRRGPLLLSSARPRNALMFAPSGIEPADDAAAAAAGRRIVHSNTRMPEGDASGGDADDAASVASEASTAGYRTPVINGYRMVDPVGLREERRFRIQEASPREVAAQRLGRRRRRHGEQPRAGHSSGTPARAALLSPAAQRLLGRSSSGRSAAPEAPGDDSLRRAYNSPYTRRPG